MSAITDSDTIASTGTGYGRGFGGTTAAAVVAGDRLIKIGALLEEKGTAVEGYDRLPTQRENYISILTKTIESGNLQGATMMLDGIGKVDETTMRKVWEFDEEFNMHLYTSTKQRLDTSSGPLYSMDGFDAQVMTHQFDMAGLPTPDWSTYNEMFSPLFGATDSSDVKTAFCGQNAYQSVVSAARNVGVHPEKYLSELGSEVTAINVDGGTIQLVKDYQSFWGADMAGDMRIVDARLVEYRQMKTFGRSFIPNVQDNNEIMIKKTAMVQAGSLKVSNEWCHGIVTGISGPYTAERK